MDEDDTGRFVLILAFAIFGAFTLWLNLGVRSEQQFAFLAHSFLHGHLGFMEQPGGTWGDTTPYNGGYYWPLGPLPAIVLMPFVAVAEMAGQVFYQGYLQPFLVLAVLWLVFLIARRLGYGREDSAWWAFAFGYATAFLGVAMWPWSWYFAQTVSCLLLFAAIYEMAGRRRPWVLGSLFALLLATRVTAALAILWCIAESLRSTDPPKRKLAALAGYALPCMLVVVALMSYNYARFDNPLDQGYAHQIVSGPPAVARTHGIMSPRHVPTNLYYMFLAGPVAVSLGDGSTVTRFPFVQANFRGMSLLLTSPCLLVLFTLRLRDRTSLLLILTCVVIALPLLFYYGTGSRQFGYRYALDFIPLLYFMLMRAWREQRGDLSGGFKALLMFSALLNLYLFAAHFVFA